MYFLQKCGILLKENFSICFGGKSKGGNTLSFGPHLLIDSVIPQVPTYEEVKDFLNSMVHQIGMTKITVPIITEFDKGIYGIVIIAESHISVLAQKYDQILFQVDIFSCKNFDNEKAVAFTKKYFGMKRIVDKVVMRGTYFPSDVPYDAL